MRIGVPVGMVVAVCAVYLPTTFTGDALRGWPRLRTAWCLNCGFNLTGSVSCVAYPINAMVLRESVDSAYPEKLWSPWEGDVHAAAR